MEDDIEYMDRLRLSLELLKSIRELDARIDELKMIVGDGPYPGQSERRQKVVDRVTRLIETRFCLVYSFLDINPQFKSEKKFESCNPFDNIPVSYEMLRRPI